MKKIILLVILFSGNVFAGEVINCTNAMKTDHTYRLQELSSGDYQLTVKKIVTDTNSCQSRWGCDTEGKIVYTDRLKATDYQGVMYFESKKTTVNMEYMDEVDYTYTSVSNDRFVTRSETLNCEIE